MILGIGIDACQISRFESKALESNFAHRYFTSGEQDYIRSKGKQAVQTLASLFASKEAALKALGIGIASIPLSEIEICHTLQGQPYYKFLGKAAQAVGLHTLHLSITHEAGLAIAVAILEKGTYD